MLMPFTELQIGRGGNQHFFYRVEIVVSNARNEQQLVVRRAEAEKRRPRCAVAVG